MATTVRCPRETCFGNLYQEEWMLHPRCDTCVQEFVLVGANCITDDKQAKVTVTQLLAEIEDLKDKLSEIRALLGGY